MSAPQRGQWQWFDFTLQSVLHRCACIAIISVNKENRKRETMVRGSMDPNFSRAREREKEDSIQISNQSVSVDCRELLTRRWSFIHHSHRKQAEKFTNAWIINPIRPECDKWINSFTNHPLHRITDFEKIGWACMKTRLLGCVNSPFPNGVMAEILRGFHETCLPPLFFPNPKLACSSILLGRSLRRPHSVWDIVLRRLWRTLSMRPSIRRWSSSKGGVMRCPGGPVAIGRKKESARSVPSHVEWVQKI